MFAVVGKLFYSFDEAEKALNELKEKGNHPLRVYNSQFAKGGELQQKTKQLEVCWSFSRCI